MRKIQIIIYFVGIIYNRKYSVYEHKLGPIRYIIFGKLKQ